MYQESFLLQWSVGWGLMGTQIVLLKTCTSPSMVEVVDRWISWSYMNFCDVQKMVVLLKLCVYCDCTLM